MVSKLKHTAQFVALAVVLYRVIHCSKFDMEAEMNYRSAGDPPEKPNRCYGSDDIEFTTCCIIPPFFSSEIANKCGTKGAIRYQIPEQNITGYARIGMSCDTWTCTLDQYHLLVNDKLDDKRYNMHLTRWVKLNPEFEETIPKAKTHCRQLYFMQFPMDPCKYKDYHKCYRNYIRMDCPVMINSTICDEQKKFYDECREYFLKK